MTEVRAIQLEQTELRTTIDAAVTDVAPQLLLLLLESPLLKLQEYAPTCKALTDPPYTFPPRVELLLFVLVALQLKQTKLLLRTVTSLASVGPLVLLLEAAELKLHEYAPTYKMLSDPPYELAPNTLPPLLLLRALQLEHAEAATVTDTWLTLLAPLELLLLLDEAPLKLHEYAPTCRTLIDPPYEFAP